MHTLKMLELLQTILRRSTRQLKELKTLFASTPVEVGHATCSSTSQQTRQNYRTW